MTCRYSGGVSFINFTEQRVAESALLTTSSDIQLFLLKLTLLTQTKFSSWISTLNIWPRWWRDFKLLQETSGNCSVHKCPVCLEKKNRLDVTEYFIALKIRSTYFGQFYAHHQELETICVLLPPMVCSGWLLVVGGQVRIISAINHSVVSS